VILIFQPIPKPAVNDLPLVANLTEIEKVRPFFLQVSEEEKAAHHPGVVGVLFRPSVVFSKDRSSRHSPTKRTLHTRTLHTPMGCVLCVRRWCSVTIRTTRTMCVVCGGAAKTSFAHFRHE
jgi:hypothetical protein